MTLPIEQHDSRPTVPLTEVQRVRLAEIADRLAAARTQGYVETHVLSQVLDLVRQIAPGLLAG